MSKQDFNEESKGVSILLAEDNDINRQLVQLQLKKLGINDVHAVTNGEEVIRAVLGKAYSLILMDNMMPVMDGLEATRQIRSRERAEKLPATPIIAMTGLVLQSEKDNCYQAGMDDFLAKPFTLENLQMMIQKWHP